MTKKPESLNRKTNASTEKPLSKVESKKKLTMPVWAVVLIMVAVFVVSYLALKDQDQQEPVVSGLPLEVSVTEAAELDQKDWFFLDVREPSEWEEAHISYATLIPLGELTARLSEIPKDKNIIVVCRSGNRSAVGRDLLLNSGFANVTSMAGGMNDWRAQGHPVVTGP
jgi:rhodanese-related sulfurtransferase